MLCEGAATKDLQWLMMLPKFQSVSEMEEKIQTQASLFCIRSKRRFSESGE